MQRKVNSFFLWFYDCIDWNFSGYKRKPLNHSVSDTYVKEVPYDWRPTTGAWMVCSIMEEWLRALNVVWKQQNCHIQILLDNEICHPCHELLVHFPANTTSVSQHVDQGRLHAMTVSQHNSYVLCHWTCKFHFSPCAAIWIVKLRKQVCLQTVQNSKTFC
jgi:hypothetical protein